MLKPNQDPDRPAVTRALAAMEVFQQRLMALHATEFTTLDITMAQAKLLYVVATAGELSMSEIAQRLGVTISTTSGAVERLVELGLLARTEDPANRRQVCVSVTETGTATLEQVRELSIHQLRTLFEHMTDNDLGVIERAIRIMTDAASAAAPAAAPAAAGAQPEAIGASR
jgi:DNA-binding MarR family transcriptional regulator